MIVNPTVPQARFLMLDCKFPLFLAGYGCVHPDTKIWTERGLMRIADITAPVRVLSWSEKDQRFQLSLSGGSFLKQTGSLFRIVTLSGEFLAAGNHRMLDCCGQYLFASDLRVGDRLAEHCVGRAETTLEISRLTSISGEQHSNQTIVDYLRRYADAARQYGQQLQRDQDIDPASLPSLDGVREYIRSCACADGLQEQGQERSPNSLFVSRVPMRHFLSHGEGWQASSVGAYGAAQCSQHSDSESHTPILQTSVVESLLMNEPHRITALESLGALIRQRSIQESWKSPLDVVGNTIIHTDEIKGNYGHWDMQVLDTNNYVDEHGFIHHNSGKSFALLVSAVNDLFLADDARVAVYSDTYDQLRLNLFPRFADYLDEAGIKYTANKSDYTLTIGKRELIFRSIDNPRRIIGYEVFRSHVDEIEAAGNESKAEEVWRKIIARNRQRCGEHQNRVSVYTTPDQGFGFTFKKWSNPASSDYQYVRASSRSNPYNPTDYVAALEADYPAEMVRAFVDGEWCNITAGSVYYFDRTKHGTTETVNGSEPLHIGMDFNVRNMAAVVTNGKGYAVDELIGYLDTPDIIRAIRERYPANQISVYPDASGGNASSKGAGLTDITMLRGAGFTVRAGTHNPPVRDRVNIVNKRLETGELLVNISRCPQLAEALEKQAYNKAGEPDKESGFDHATDAIGYATAYRFPLTNRRQQIYAR